MDENSLVNILLKVNNLSGLDGTNVAEKIENELKLAIQREKNDTERQDIENACNDWKEDNNFKIDHFFKIDGYHTYTLLHLAAKNGYINVVNALIHTEAKIDLMDELGYTPLHLAAKNGHISVVNALEAKYSWYTPFLFAVMYNRVNVVKFLLENEICKIDSDALYHASARGYAKMVRLLLEKGADPNEVGKFGQIPLHWAAEKDYIIDRSDDFIMSNGWKLLHDDRKSFSKEIVELLLQYKANVNAVDGFGQISLHLVASSGSIWVANALIEKGANINAVDRDGDTPLHRAARNKCKDIAEALLKNGAKADVVNKYGMSPLHCAAEWFKPSSEVVEFLSKHGDINAVDNDGNTPLHLAVKQGNTQIVQTLLANGANHSLQNKEGETPIDFAKDQEVRKLLKKAEEKAKIPVKNCEENLLLESNQDKVPEKEQSKKVTDRFTQDDSEKKQSKPGVSEQILLANVANPLSEDKTGETPINLAKDQEMRKLLEETKEEQSKKVTDSSKCSDEKKQSSDSDIIEEIVVGPTSKSSTNFFSKHKWEIALIADFVVGIAVGTIFGFTISLNIGIAVGLSCAIIGAIIGGAAYMLSEPKSEVTVEQTPVEKVVSEGQAIAQPA